MERAAYAGTDPVLWPFLEADDDQEREDAAGRLLSEHAEPVVTKVIRRRLHLPLDRDHPDSEDIRAQVLVQLLGRLEALRSRPAERPIANLAAYAAVMAYHACDRYLRQRHPARWRLKSRIRYALSHVADLALWEREGEWLAGLAGWSARGRAAARAGRREMMRDTPAAAAEAAFNGRDPHRLPLPEFLRTILEWVGGPVELDDLVTVAATAWGTSGQEGVETPHRDDEGASPAPGMEAVLDCKRYLAFLWQEVRQLPARQRVALLLNLRDGQGRDVLELFTLTGTASMRGLAEALEMPAEALAALWKELPLDDARLAERLGLTRQQVANLRKCARERLARRLTAAGMPV